MPRESFRLRFSFWLDLKKPFEDMLAEAIDQLKNERMFSRAIREGLAIWLTLRERDTSLLFELHPWILENIQTPAPPTPEGGSELISRLDRLEMLLLQSKTDSDKKIMSSNTKNYPVNEGAYKDIELKVETAKTDKDNRSDYNFMIASAINVYGNYDSLPPEIIDYGLRTGRIPADAVQRKVVETIHVPLGGTQPRHTGGPKQMDVPQFDAPTFDDDVLGDYL